MIQKPDSCRACPLYGSGYGFMPEPIGEGTARVLLVGEALGEAESYEGRPFVGKAGLQLTQMLQRFGMKREEFWIDNTLRCRPPDNKLVGQPYAAEAIAHCSPFLDGTIRSLQPLVIVPMGGVALRRILPHATTISAYRGYVEYSQLYKAWVLPTFHPAYIMRGNHRLTNVFAHDIGAARTIALAGGWQQREADFLCDPTPLEFEWWIDAYLQRVGEHPSTLLAYDIETPYKQKADEGDLELDDPSQTILRISFAYNEDGAISVPWTSPYFAGIRSLLCREGPVKVVHNGAYDNPRLAAQGFPVAGPIWDSMWAWHVLNSDLEKGLEFITPLLLTDQPRWKHLANTDPARYNAIDSLVTLRIMLKIKQELERNRLWNVFERHIVRLDACLQQMSAAGIQLDLDARSQLSRELVEEQGRLDLELQSVVPLEVKRKKVFKRDPGEEKRGKGMWTQVEEISKEKTCSRCGEWPVTKPHVAKKSSVCYEADIELKAQKVQRWARIEPFSPSKVQMQTYQGVMGHKPIRVRTREGMKETFNEDALKLLMGRYRQDRLYPLTIDVREVETLLTRYVGTQTPDGWEGGLDVDPDGLVHTTYGHNPSTLRLSSSNPNLQNIPHGGDSGGWQDRVKNLFVGAPGHLLWEVDYAGIEAVLVGYFAGSQDYIRLARLGVHDYFNSFVLRDSGKVGEAADIRWSDDDLRRMFGDLKRGFPLERQGSKKVVHSSNYAATAGTIYSKSPELFQDEGHAARLQQLYFDVCPDVKKWQEATVNEADKKAFLRNPFGYVHRFWNVKSWTKLPDGSWESKWAENAKAALAFNPQSTACGIIVEAILRLFAGHLGGHLRLQVHDSLVGQSPSHMALEVVRAVAEEMRRPIPELPLDPMMGLGSHLWIGTEAKVGERWGEGMRACEM